MALVTIGIDCDVCLNHYEETVLLDARNNKYVKDVLAKAKQKGWHIGFRTVCPDCAKVTRDKVCHTCKHRVEKSMCPPICELKSYYPYGDFIVIDNDFCDDYEK